MEKYKLKYNKPKIKKRLIKINYFMSKNLEMGQESIYLAQSCVCCGNPSISISCCLGC